MENPVSIKAILVDDEPSARNVLGNLLKLAHPNVEVVAESSSVPEAVVKINALKPDVVFLDIEMPKYAGYEIIRFIKEIDFQIVFVTAYDQYAIKAFELSAVDYLLKPVERARLSATVKVLEQRVELKSNAQRLEKLLVEMEREKSPTISFSESGKKHLVKTRDIIAICAQGAYSDILIADGKKITISKNIGTMENELSSESSIFRSHKSWLVNLNHIQSYKKGLQVIIMSNGTECKLSRFKKAEFEDRLNSVEQ